MKTKAELQRAVDEIRAVCRKHGIVLEGVSFDENIDAEIQIAEKFGNRSKWKADVNKIKELDWDDDVRFFYVEGIG